MSHTATYRIDDRTLREVLDDPDAATRRARELETAGPDAGPAVIGERVALLRMLGRLDEAEQLGREAVAWADDDERRISATLRLAHVLQWQHRFDEADALFAAALAEAGTLGHRVLLAFGHQHAGKSLFDQGRYREACDQVARALELRIADSAPPDQIASSRQALTRMSELADADVTAPEGPARPD